MRASEIGPPWARRGGCSGASEIRFSQASQTPLLHRVVVGVRLAALLLLSGVARDDLAAQEAPAADTVRLPALQIDVRRSLFDPGLVRSVERLEPGRELFPFRDLGDWLATRTSAVVRGHGGGGRQVLSVRGGRPEGVLVLIDGVPLNDPLTGQADLSSVPLSTLESATLVRGAGAARYGSGALSGVLLLESARAAAAEPAGRVAFGSHGAYEASGSAAWLGGRSAVRVGAGVAGATNDYVYEDRLAHNAPERRRDNADSDSRWVNLAAEVGDQRGGVRFDRLERGVPGRMGTAAFEDDRWREQRWSLSGRTAGELGAARVGIRGLSMRYAPGDASTATDQRALDARAGGEVALPGTGDVVLAGRLSYERLEGDGLGGSPVRWSAGATARAALALGGDTDPATDIGIEPLVGFDVTDGGAALSPELGAWVRPSETVRVYGRVGRAYRVPTFADLHFEAAPGLRANPDLEPERVVLDGEVGVEVTTHRGTRGGPAASVRGGPAASVRISGWLRDTRRPIAWLASTASVWSPRNLDRLSARGLEVEGRIASAEAASVGWALDAAVSLQRSRVGFGSNRNPLPYQPDFTARSAAELRRGRSAARLELRYTGSRTTTLAATRRLDGFATLDVSLRRRLAAGPLEVDAALGVDNLLDARYELVELFPEPGRTLRLTIDIH